MSESAKVYQLKPNDSVTFEFQYMRPHRISIKRGADGDVCVEIHDIDEGSAPDKNALPN